MHLLKNPIVFGSLVGIVLCILLYLHDKFLGKKNENKSTFGTYTKLFFGALFSTTPLVYLLYNRNLSFSSNPENISPEISSIAKTVAASTAAIATVSSIVNDEPSNNSIENVVEMVQKKKIKKTHSDAPNW